MDAQPQSPALPSSDVMYRRWYQAVWASVLVANLPLPSLLGWLSADVSGRIGMAAAVALVWLLGHLAINRIGARIEPLLLGSVATAFLQPFLLVHGFAGQIALGLAMELDPAATSRHVSAIGGFLATLLTAGQLMLLALMVGTGFRALVWHYS